MSQLAISTNSNLYCHLYSITWVCASKGDSIALQTLSRTDYFHFLILCNYSYPYYEYCSSFL